MHAFRDKSRQNGGVEYLPISAFRFTFHVSRFTFPISRFTFHAVSFFPFLCFLFVFAGSVSAEIGTWTVGGSEHPWEAWGEMKMMDYVVDAGAIQPRAFHPDENIVPMLKWYLQKSPILPGYRKGDPRAWRGLIGGWESYSWAGLVVDGDPITADAYFLAKGAAILARGFWTLDFGIPIPGYKVVFYPRQEGVDNMGRPSKNNYMQGYTVSGGLGEDFPIYEEEPWPGSFGDVPHLEHELGQNEYNVESVVTLAFPPQFMRLFRVQNMVDRPFELAEIEIYADGFAAVATYTSKIIDLGSPFNFGKLSWAWSKLRRIEDGTLVAAPDADLSVTVETRSGKDDTPLVYHKTMELGKEMVITEEEYYYGGLKLAPTSPGGWLAPNQQGSITEDTDHWSFWSLPHFASGEEITSPGPRRYFQFRVTLKTDAVNDLARVDSLFFRVSPPLVDEVVGELAVLGDPAPLDDVARVAGGERTTFTYDVRATASPGQKGFDGLEIAMPSEATFKDLRMGDPLTSLALDAYEVIDSDPGRLVVRFPSHRIVDGTLVRVVFDTSVLVFGTRFEGKVFDTEGDHLAQPIQPGNANDAVSTDKVWVWITEESLREGFLMKVGADPEAITPNGDGIGDEARISYTLLQLTGEALVEVLIWDVLGRQVRRVYVGRETNGRYDRPSGSHRHKVWDGRDEDGDLVRPGVYLYTLSAKTDAETTRKVGRIAVVY